MTSERSRLESKRLAMQSEYDHAALPQATHAKLIYDVFNDYRLDLLLLTRCAWEINEGIK